MNLTLLVITLALLACTTAGSAAPQDVPSDSPTISVNVSLVVLQATARGRNGEFVSDLRQEDFHVFEDGHPQAIRLFRHEDVPVSVGLVVDDSTSMRHKRRDVAAAAVAFAHSSNPKDEMFVVNFNERVSLGLPAGQLFSANPIELEVALNGLPAGGMTALYDAMDVGLDHLKKAQCDKKVLIVVSDGGDNASHRQLDQVLDHAARSDAVIYTIGVFDENDDDRNPGVLKRIARATGGEAFFPPTAADVAPICQRIASDIRHQYTIGYTSTNPKLDDTFRAIKLTATPPHGGKVFVRTRSGYIAASPRSASEQAAREGGR